MYPETLGLGILFFEIIVINNMLFVCYYGELDNSQYSTQVANPTDVSNSVIKNNYLYFKHLQMMIYIGFGLLMSFRNKFTWSGMAYPILMIPLVMQLFLLIDGFLPSQGFQVNILQLIQASQAALSYLIAYGAVLGRITPAQMIMMACVHVVLFAYIPCIFQDHKIIDVGGSLNISTFGALFGFFSSCVIQLKNQSASQINYRQNVWAFLGCMFLVYLWPTLNLVYVINGSPLSEYRIMMNTIISVSASSLSSFTVMCLCKGSLNIRFIGNAAISGAIAIGSSSNILVNPGWSLLVGYVTGTISTLGFVYLDEEFQKKGIDSCGVIFTFGIPGILSAIVSAIVVSTATQDVLGTLYTSIFLKWYSNGLQDQSNQAGLQIGGFFLIFTLSLIAVFLSRLMTMFFNQPECEFDDELLWNNYQTTKEQIVMVASNKMNMSQPFPQLKMGFLEDSHIECDIESIEILDQKIAPQIEMVGELTKHKEQAQIIKQQQNKQ